MRQLHGDKEKKERKADIKYIKNHFDNVNFVEFKDMGHGSMPAYHPELFVSEIEKIIS